MKMRKLLAIVMCVAMVMAIAVAASAEEVSYNATLGFANSDWSIQEWGTNVNTTVTGPGTYTLTFTPSAPVSDALVFVIDIVGAGAAFTEAGYTVTNVTLTADGVTVPVNMPKLVTGDLENNGNFRIEIHNEYGSTKEDPAINYSTLAFSESLVISFTITDPNAVPPKTGDPITLACAALLCSAMGVTAIVGSKKRA